MALPDRCSGTRQNILVLTHVLQRFQVKALQAYEHATATSLRQSLQVLGVADDVEGDAGPPAYSQRRERVAKPAQMRGTTAEIVVVENRDVPQPPGNYAAERALSRGDFGSDRFD